jgi:hypothetical protein
LNRRQRAYESRLKVVLKPKTRGIVLVATPADDQVFPRLLAPCTVAVLSCQARAIAADLALKAYLTSLADSIADGLMVAGIR